MPSDHPLDLPVGLPLGLIVPQQTRYAKQVTTASRRTEINNKIVGS